MVKKNKIKITVNGKYLFIVKDFSIEQLLNKLKIPSKMVAVELNKEIMDKKKFNKIILKKRDNIEIVHFIGGG